MHQSILSLSSLYTICLSCSLRSRDLFCYKLDSFHSSRMFTSTFTRALRTCVITSKTTPLRASNRAMASFKPNSGPPKHEMVYFPGMTTSLPSSSAEFRKVLFTGLYSQVVLMTIPVGGDIGDEGERFTVMSFSAAL